MSVFFRRPAEARAVSMVDWGTAADLDAIPSTSMVSALSVVPVFAATRLLSDSISTLPLQTFRESGDVRTRIPSRDVFGADKAHRIRWVQQALMSLLLRGNAYGYVAAFTSDGMPGRVVWLNPEHVHVDESQAVPVYRYRGAEIPRELMRHIPAYLLPGSVVGVSPIGACSLLADTGRSTQKMMADWFKYRALPGSTFQNVEQALLPDDADALSDRLNARMRNGKPLVFGKDWKFEPVTMSADDAAFIASARMNATQVASIYGIPPEMIGGETGSSLTYSTVELNAINFAQQALRPWTEKLEEEFTSWLPRPQFVKFNMDAMIRVDTKTRYDVHKIAREIGLNNVDELRALEDLAPLPDGQGQDYTPLAKVGATVPKEAR